jgi:hypothetical protein
MLDPFEVWAHSGPANVNYKLKKVKNQRKIENLILNPFRFRVSEFVLIPEILYCHTFIAKISVIMV